MQIVDKEKIDEYYNALVDRNVDYRDKYLVGVKTTGIYCLSICSARKPLKKNVTFYTTKEEVLAAGFRSCKVCKPDQIR